MSQEKRSLLAQAQHQPTVMMLDSLLSRYNQPLTVDQYRTLCVDITTADNAYMQLPKDVRVAWRTSRLLTVGRGREKQKSHFGHVPFPKNWENNSLYRYFVQG